MNHKNQIQSILILGGGTAGWMTAAALAKALRDIANPTVSITLVESEAIGTVGVGEATIPPIKTFNATLGLDERDFLKNTRGTFKLGIEFVDWGRIGNRYFHPFGTHGRNFDMVALHQHWLLHRNDTDLPPLDELSMAWAIAKRQRFSPPHGDPRNVLSTYDYAYHFDATLYAGYLRRFAEALGVRRVEGKVDPAATQLAAETGFVQSITLEGGQCLEAEFFIDCSGFRGLLIEQVLGVGYQDWSHWLPCDRAVSVPCAVAADLAPYTRSTAHQAGWQWRIPLQHRIGNGHVYGSAYMSDDQAADILIRHLDSAPQDDPRQLRFVTGMRKQFWHKNVVAIGLSSGFLEPLESTSIHLIQAGIAKLLALFPDNRFDPSIADEYNRIAINEFERIRDFIILHYRLTNRDDTPFWRYVANMDIPDSVQWKIDHFRKFGRLLARDADLFGPASWLAVHVGQGNIPEGLDPLVHHRAVDGKAYCVKLHRAMAHAAEQLPTHRAFLERFCAAGGP